MKPLLVFTLLFYGMPAMSQQENSALSNDIIKTWAIHTSMSHKLLESVSKESLSDQSASGGRSVGQQFAHIHNVRVQWLKELDKEHSDQLNELSKEDSHDQEKLSRSLKQSDEMITKYLTDKLAMGTDTKPMSPVTFMGYLISHESHTRGQIILSLKQAGHPVGPNIAYGIWNWSQ
ncbi:MAG: hypothetical protein KDC99_16230 [Cyclobacteriaceae bacterium]|nr:hypothetical protein [Cyclobacteriaceae bacterium]